MSCGMFIGWYNVPLPLKSLKTRFTYTNFSYKKILVGREEREKTHKTKRANQHHFKHTNQHYRNHSFIIQHLKALRMRLRGKEDMIRIVQLIKACAILHNLCIQDPVPSSWIDIEEEENIENEEEIYVDQDKWEKEGGARRDRLLNVLMETQ